MAWDRTNFRNGMIAILAIVVTFIILGGPCWLKYRIQRFRRWRQRNDPELEAGNGRTSARRPSDALDGEDIPLPTYSEVTLEGLQKKGSPNEVFQPLTVDLYTNSDSHSSVRRSDSSMQSSPQFLGVSTVIRMPRPQRSTIPNPHSRLFNVSCEDIALGREVVALRSR